MDPIDPKLDPIDPRFDPNVARFMKNDLLVAREGVKGAETRIFDARGPNGVRFTMTEPWTLLLLDDARVIHESTPIQPTGDAVGYRDTLVITFRAGGFQGPLATPELRLLEPT